MLYKIFLNVLQILNIKYFQHLSQIIYILYIIKSDLQRLVTFDKFTNLCSFSIKIQNTITTLVPYANNSFYRGGGIQGLEPGALHMLIKYSTTELYSQPSDNISFYVCIYCAQCECMTDYQSMLSVFLNPSSPYVLRQCLSLRLDLPVPSGSAHFHAMANSFLHGHSGSKLRSSSLHNTHFTK